MTLPPTSHLRRATVVRLLAVAATVALGATLLTTASSAEGEPSLAAVPRADCGPGSRPETSIQGRVPARDYRTGRAQKGYTCNTRQVSHHGGSGGFKVLRYVDRTGRACAYYDSTLLSPIDVPFNVGREGTGVVVLDMSDPRRPRQTANLVTPAMQSPHESLLLNKRRGLLVAVLGNPATNVGVIDVYDLKGDCRSPRLLSSTPSGVFGHESGFAPDGRTFYVASTSAQTLVAVDLTDPRVPRPIWTRTGVVYHGMRVSADGNRLYVAEIGNPGNGVISNGGLAILDVSEIQSRRPDPRVPVVSRLSWRSGSIPQVAIPVTIRGRKYLLEVDEFANYGTDELTTYDEDAKVGAARLIDISDERHPSVVSNIRLQVHQPRARRGPAQHDPGAQLQVQGYAGHYCSVPRARDPKLVACSFIASGLRIFDIRDPRKPREVGYFNKPLEPGVKPAREGAHAMSAPAWDMKRKQVWYTDGNTGFYAVRLTNGIAPRW
ncbi:MAG TPA: hypothetical protein VLB29_11450 [Nocardioidaceae bacterium]|nr:hypothetical protein [Nocardioidaceae bacterium]